MHLSAPVPIMREVRRLQSKGFNGATRAALAAAPMDGAVSERGLRGRVGLHTGEVEISGGQARGVAVHAAARVAALAPGMG